jgi:hypothetical protein
VRVTLLGSSLVVMPFVLSKRCSSNEAAGTAAWGSVLTPALSLLLSCVSPACDRCGGARHGRRLTDYLHLCEAVIHS